MSMMNMVGNSLLLIVIIVLIASSVSSTQISFVSIGDWGGT